MISVDMALKEDNGLVQCRRQVIKQIHYDLWPVKKSIFHMIALTILVFKPK